VQQVQEQAHRLENIASRQEVGITNEADA